MATTDLKELKIFKLNRLKYQELWEDALSYVKQTYSAVGQKFNIASPFSQLLSVILHLSRMIFYYIEDSITGLNIRTAYRPDQIKGLAMLAGHDAARSISARGAIKINYIDIGEDQYNGSICYIPNKSEIVSSINGLTYTVLFNQDAAKIVMQSGNYIEATIIQGKIKAQSATGTGLELQSYNFSERNYGEIDQYFINVYVNNEPWAVVTSLLDLGYNQKGCVVRTGLTGGIDVFFGNGSMGQIPPLGSIIMVEYIVTDGSVANITKEQANGSDFWTFVSDGTLSDGTKIALNKFFKITCLTDIIFGTMSENTALTQLIAPHVSRSFVLANETNYLYFFQRMNMFSTINIFQGTSGNMSGNILQMAYDQANIKYNDALVKYNNLLSTYGEDSDLVNSAYLDAQDALNIVNYAKEKLYTNSFKDNTIYLYLVPDIKKRISSSQNYFSCDESLFTLSIDEQANIINLINASGQKLITVENRILSPKIARFAVNIQAKIWDNYNERDVYASGLQALSSYLLNFNRKDIIPVSDIISIFENNVNGIDSVKVWFDADVNNEIVYNQPGFYGLDDYGDIILTRNYIDTNAQNSTINDILPLIRGGFTSPQGIEYFREQSFENLSGYNLIITGKTVNLSKTLTNYTAIT